MVDRCRRRFYQCLPPLLIYGRGIEVHLSSREPLCADAWDRQMLFLVLYGYRASCTIAAVTGDPRSRRPTTIWTPMRTIWPLGDNLTTRGLDEGLSALATCRTLAASRYKLSRRASAVSSSSFVSKTGRLTCLSLREIFESTQNTISTEVMVL